MYVVTENVSELIVTRPSGLL